MPKIMIELSEKELERLRLLAMDRKTAFRDQASLLILDGIKRAEEQALYDLAQAAYEVRNASGPDNNPLHQHK